MTGVVQGLCTPLQSELDVLKARLILVALISASPAILLWAGQVTQGLVVGIVAAGLMITAGTLRPSEAQFFISIIRPLAAVAAVPALWMVIQLLPLRALAHPIWASAETALGHVLPGAISIDLGASVVALGQYLSLTAVAFLSAAVGVDRQRAVWILFALSWAGTAIALILFAQDLLFAGAEFALFQRMQAIDCVAMGAIAASAACIRTIEQYENRHSTPQRPMPILQFNLTAFSVALAICAAALVFNGTREVLVATGCGVAPLACVMIIRRIGTWGTAIIAGPVIGIAILLIITQPAERGSSLLLAYAGSPTAVSKRVLEDAPLVGTGAGTFAAIAPIYREVNDPPPDSIAPTAVAALAIELGQPMLWLIATAAACSIVILLRASLQRGRDSFYPTMGAGCLITSLLLAFSNAGVLGTATGLFIAAALGLGFAQSKSRTGQLQGG